MDIFMTYCPGGTWTWGTNKALFNWSYSRVYISQYLIEPSRNRQARCVKVPWRSEVTGPLRRCAESDYVVSRSHFILPSEVGGMCYHDTSRLILSVSADSCPVTSINNSYFNPYVRLLIITNCLYVCMWCHRNFPKFIPRAFGLQPGAPHWLTPAPRGPHNYTPTPEYSRHWNTSRKVCDVCGEGVNLKN